MSEKMIDLMPEHYAVLTPRQFLDLYLKSPKSIERVQVVPPKLGQRGFGKIRIKRRVPVYRRQRVFAK